MGPFGVVVLDVRDEDGTEVSFAGDEEAVGAFGAGCAYPSFGERWTVALRRGRDDGCAVAGELASNAAVNLLSRSRMRNRKHPALSPRSMSRLRASWVTHAPVG